MSDLKIIGVHVPKSGGTSIAHGLRVSFAGEFLADYADDPAIPEGARQIDPVRHLAGQPFPASVSCVYGHFHPNKYRDCQAARFTILRHPVDTIISIYTYWRSTAPGGTHHQYFLAQNLSPVELARMPLFQNLLSQTYFGGFDMARFDLIGRHDRHTDTIRKLEDLCGRSIRSDIYENVTTYENKEEIHAEESLRSALTDILLEDIRFYERWAFRHV
jgi:hypothetical protein